MSLAELPTIKDSVFNLSTNSSKMNSVDKLTGADRHRKKEKRVKFSDTCTIIELEREEDARCFVHRERDSQTSDSWTMSRIYNADLKTISDIKLSELRLDNVHHVMDTCNVNTTRSFESGRFDESQQWKKLYHSALSLEVDLMLEMCNEMSEF